MADGGPVIQGSPGWSTNVTQTPTQLVNGAAAGDGTGLYLFSGGDGRGLYVVGRGANQPGVQSYGYAGDGVSGVALPYGGAASNAGVRGQSLAPSGAGVHGSHRRFVGVWGDGPIGAVGQSMSDYGIGVEGDASGQGAIGVFGSASGARGVGVYATAPSPDSAALQVNGRAVFSSAGRITVPAGATSGTQAGLSLSGAAFVLATLQQDLQGVLVRAAVVDAAAGTVTVHLDQAPAVDVLVGWMAVN
jgi:hypothetical protein